MGWCSACVYSTITVFMLNGLLKNFFLRGGIIDQKDKNQKIYFQGG